MFRRSEVVALEVTDLVEMPDGYRATIRRSKTDQEGQGQEIAIPRGYCPESLTLPGTAASASRGRRRW